MVRAIQKCYKNRQIVCVHVLVIRTTDNKMHFRQRGFCLPCQISYFVIAQGNQLKVLVKKQRAKRRVDLLAMSYQKKIVVLKQSIRRGYGLFSDNHFPDNHFPDNHFLDSSFPRQLPSPPSMLVCEMVCHLYELSIC